MPDPSQLNDEVSAEEDVFISNSTLDRFLTVAEERVGDKIVKTSSYRCRWEQGFESKLPTTPLVAGSMSGLNSRQNLAYQWQAATTPPNLGVPKSVENVNINSKTSQRLLLSLS
ncbi:hypothetical protein FOL47_007516 [Perkinsus chesapeaki]|uniref:Uncharacterized protein n=1 Tax=Perkinsus chesapeaki TaxID=330153 RepID=A0A7J6LKM6_PERCH|nr:hypothetical protein FOL47_007516 [Perkinsus chesapeaki]